MYRARWQEGRDICDRAVVADIATALGLPDAVTDRMAGAADDPELRAGRGLRALLNLSGDGAFGVPFFTLGYDKYWGVDRLPAFAGAVRSRDAPSPVSRTPRTPVPGTPADADFAAARSGDQGHAGGCG